MLSMQLMNDLRRIDLNLLVILDALLSEQHVTRASSACTWANASASGIANSRARSETAPLPRRTQPTATNLPNATLS